MAFYSHAVFCHVGRNVLVLHFSGPYGTEVLQCVTFGGTDIATYELCEGHYGSAHRNIFVTMKILGPATVQKFPLHANIKSLYIPF